MQRPGAICIWPQQPTTQFARTSKRLLVRIYWWTHSSLRILMKQWLGAGQPAKPVLAVLRPVGRPASNCDDSWEMGVKKSATCCAGVCTPREMESTLCLQGRGNTFLGVQGFCLSPPLSFSPPIFTFFHVDIIISIVTFLTR